MTEEEKLEYVKEHFLQDALSSIEHHGRYWNPSISRTLTSALRQQLETHGYNVIVWEIPPQWEHVFYLQEHANSDYQEEVRRIAEKRYSLMEGGANESQLPK